MEPIITILVAILIIVALDAAALAWGIDSREGMADEALR